MRKPPWRRIVLGETRYRFRVHHEHHVVPEPSPGEGRCREVLSVAREGHRGARLRIEFTDGVDCHAGYPEAGVVWRSDGSKLEANLNLPRMARAAIEIAYPLGWNGVARFTLDGWPLLAALVQRYDELGVHPNPPLPSGPPTGTKAHPRAARNLRSFGRLRRRDAGGSPGKA